jgi:hypothetical protein
MRDDPLADVMDFFVILYQEVTKDLYRRRAIRRNGRARLAAVGQRPGGAGFRGSGREGEAMRIARPPGIRLPTTPRQAALWLTDLVELRKSDPMVVERLAMEWRLSYDAFLLATAGGFVLAKYDGDDLIIGAEF